MSANHKSAWKLSTISSITLLALYLVSAVILVVLININSRQQALRNAEFFANMILKRNVASHFFLNEDPKHPLSSLSRTFVINSTTSDYGLFTMEGLYYKESAINARNPVHEADDQERSFIEQLNIDPQLITMAGIREYDQEPFFTVMRRGQTVKEECLLCHGDPAQAPPEIVAHYGSERGFLRQAGETVSAISIRIPLTLAYQDANRFSFKLSGFLMLILLVIFAVQYILTRQLLFVPINTLYRKAQRIANEPEHLDDTLPLPAGRELGELVEAFNAMSNSLRRHHDAQALIIRHRTEELEEANRALSNDIEIRKGVERTLEQLRHHNEMILNATSEGILGVDSKGQITFFNRAAGILAGLDNRLVNQINIQDLVVGTPAKQDQPEAAELISEVLVSGGRIEHQQGLLTRMDGKTLPIEYSCAPLSEDGSSGAVFSFSDITERQRSASEIQNLAFYDQLTGLPNRTLFYDRITQRVAQLERDKLKLALMFLDLDDFKMVNDTLGHAAGDEFLRVVARRLREGSRQADTVARLGGDEFVWFGEIIDEEDARLIAEKFLEVIARPVTLGQHNFSSTVSIGIALFPESAENVAGLMKCADSAMYSVKQKSKNSYQFYRRERGS